MNEDIMKAIEQAAAKAESDQSRFEKEAYINEVVSQIQGSVYNHLRFRTAVVPEPTRSYLDAWQGQNSTRLSLQMGEVARIILCKELLGE